MSKDAKPAAEGGDQVAPKKSKKLLIIILAAVLLVVIIGGAAAFFLLKSHADNPDDEEVAETTHSKKKDKGKEVPPVFVSLEPFTVNLVPENGDQYLQVSLSVQLEGPEAEQSIKTLMPKIRNDVTLLLTSKKASELLTKEGKDTLARELRDGVNDVLVPPRRNKRGELIRADDGPAKEVLFTSFIIQ